VSGKSTRHERDMKILMTGHDPRGVLAGLARAKEQGINLGRRRLEDSDAATLQ
jgi:hypothetical protein